MLVKKIVFRFILIVSLPIWADSISISDRKKQLDVPFTIHDNRILVKAMINGTGPFTFIFDTGGSNVITYEAANKLKLVIKNEKFGSGGAGPNKAKMGEAFIKKCEISDIIMKDQTFIVIDLSHIKRAFGFKELNGVIGYELLQKFITKIDYESLKLTFMEKSEYKSIANTTVIPFRIFNHKPIIKGAINGIEGEFLVDTGDRSSFSLYPKYAQQNGLAKDFLKVPKVITGYGVGGAIMAYVSILKTLRIGEKLILNNVVARMPPHEQWEIAGSIGNQILQQFAVIFDYNAKTMGLIPNTSFGKELKFVPVVAN